MFSLDNEGILEAKLYKSSTTEYRQTFKGSRRNKGWERWKNKKSLMLTSHY